MTKRGSQKGERRGGRKKGTPNKKTAELVEKVEKSGMTPLDFLLNTMRGLYLDNQGNPIIDESTGRPVDIEFGTRLDAAKAAAPYVHAKRTHVEGSGEGGAIVVQLTGVDADL